MSSPRTSLSRLVKITTGLLLSVVLYVWFGPGPCSKSTTVIVKRSATVGTVAHQLKQNGVVRSISLFKVWAKLRRFRPIRGEYLFNTRDSMSSVTNKLKYGHVNYTKVNVPPGSNAWSIQRRFNEFIPENVFWSLWKDPRYMNIAGFPNARTMEGLIAPLVYQFNHAQDPEEIFLELAEIFRDRVRSSLDGGGLPPYKLLILASMVEKETAIPQELPLVAGVYAKRINMGMRLQCDPTVLYARWYSGDLRINGLTRDDICRKSNFNTYVVFGLPPTPIASPSYHAVVAAKSPCISSYVYFSATGRGGHVFASSLSEHVQNVKRYRNEITRRTSATKDD